MRALALIVAIALLGFGWRLADAQDANVDCQSQNLSQADMDRCAGRDFQASDAKLNALYKQLMAKYDESNQAMLKASERAWLAYRDAECTYETNAAAGGTMRPMLETMCRTAKTDARVKELDAQAHCAEGDLSCNSP